MNQILTSVGDLVSDDEYKAVHNGKPPKTPDDLKICAIWMKEFELLYSAGILKYARSIVDAEVFYNKNCRKTRPETENSCEVAKKMITEIMSIMQKVNGLISSANAILRTIETDKEKAGIPVFGRKRIIGEIEQLVGILDSSIKPTVVQYHPYTQIKASVVRFLSGMNTEKQTIRDDDIEDMYADLKGIYDSWKRDIVKAKVEAERKKMLEEIAKAERAEIQKRMKQAAANAAAAARAKQGVA
jgi:hypothetical protein